MRKQRCTPSLSARRGMPRRAAMLLFFCLVTLPTMLFTGVIAIEYQRMLTAYRAADRLTAAAAFAGVQEVVPNDPDFPSRPSDFISVADAREQALAVVTAYSNAKGTGGWVKIIGTPTVDVVQSAGTAGEDGFTPSTVTVTITYALPYQGLTGIAQAVLGLDETFTTGTSSSTAYICLPGEGLTYDSSCVENR